MGGLVISVERFRRELGYDDWANREVLRHLQRESQPPASCLRWLAHILGAQSEWLVRLRAGRSELPVWPTLTLDELEPHLARLHQEWTHLLGNSSLGDSSELAREVRYTNSKGQSWTSSVEDILTHVLLHGAHHRGQIASALRAEGLSAPQTDFIHAARNGFLE